MSQSALPFRLPAPRSGRADVLVIAGEHSGDQHAARMVRELLAEHKELTVAALGGPELAEAGAQLLYDLTASSVVGLVEVLKNLSFFKALFNEVLRWITVYRPRVVCFVDYPGMNLRLAKAMRTRGLSVKGGGDIRTLFYISPQIWAWKAGRRFSMARDLDAMAVIFPFEVSCYADTSLKVEFVGHPFVAEGYEAPVSYDPAGPILLLPGSRKQAVARIFPLMLAGYRRFLATSGGVGQTSAQHTEVKRKALVLYPSKEVLAVLKSFPLPDGVELQPTGATMAASAVLTSSGTMSMHCALAAIPGTVVYRTSPITYFFGRWLVKVPYLGIANLLLKAPMYPERIQGDATADALAAELRECLGNPARREKTAADAVRLRGILHQPTSGTAADWLGRQLGVS